MEYQVTDGPGPTGTDLYFLSGSIKQLKNTIFIRDGKPYTNLHYFTCRLNLHADNAEMNCSRLYCGGNLMGAAENIKITNQTLDDVACCRLVLFINTALHCSGICTMPSCVYHCKYTVF